MFENRPSAKMIRDDRIMHAKIFGTILLVNVISWAIHFDVITFNFPW